MAWNGSSGFWFNRPSITANAPESAGVYMLYSQNVCVYIGKATNLRDRMLAHLTNSHSDLITAAKPALFAFELVQPAFLEAREKQLILEFCPQCNQRLG